MLVPIADAISRFETNTIMATEMRELPTGTLVDEFRIDGVIGEGAMAIVYRATQTSLERPVALKVLPRELSRDKGYVDRFFNEARAAAMLSHSNIVQIYDAGVAARDICYLAMEYVEGEPLSDWIAREESLPPTTALRIALDIARALNHGWQRQKLTHGDIKPANILITERGSTKLADFGLAKFSEIEEEDEGIMLTPLYAAPEVIQGETQPNSCSGDIYAFGATLYHMVTGSPPFPHEDAEEVMRQQVEEPLIPARIRKPDIPGRVSGFLDLVLKKDPAKRPQNWTEIMSRLEHLLTDATRKRPVAQKASKSHHKLKIAQPVSAPRPRQMRKRKDTLRFVLVFLITALLVALALWLISQHF